MTQAFERSHVHADGALQHHCESDVFCEWALFIHLPTPVCASDFPQNSDLDDATKRRKIIAATNKFYTYVPMNFGLHQPTLIDSQELIKQRLQMVEELINLEVATKMLEVKREGEDKGE